MAARVTAISAVAVSHQLFILLFVGARATTLGAYLIIGLDSIPNLYSCISIIRGYRQISNDEEDDQKQTDAIQCLALKEIIEILVPAAFCITYAMAYYGPNSAIMGGIGNEYWCKHKISDIEDTLSRLGIAFLIDILRGIFIGRVLWRFCKINIVKVYGQVMKRFGLLLLVLLVAFINKVCEVLSVSRFSSLITKIKYISIHMLYQR